MLSKEEIETCKEEARKYIDFMSGRDNCGYLKGLLWYIEQLETDKQKLIEKVETDIEEYPEARYTKYYLLDLLELLKGENK